MANIGNILDPLQKQKRAFFENNKNNQKKFFLTYFHKKFENKSLKLINQMKDLNFFDNCILEKDIDKNVSQNKVFIDALKNDKFKFTFELEKGQGLWLWKPYIIYKNLQKLKDNDILVYCDPGGYISSNPILKCWVRDKLNIYFNNINNNKGCLCFLSGNVEYKSTKSEIIDYFELTDNIDFYKTNSKTSCIHFIRKCPYTMDVYKLWWETARDYPFLFDDCICRNENIYGFIEPRNDQSVWSIICKKKDVDICEDNPSHRPFRVSSRPVIDKCDEKFVGNFPINLCMNG